jgi:hypothetical protein
MKTQFKHTAIISVIFLFIATCLISQKKDNESDDSVKSQIKQSINSYDDTFFEALFSLEELRPFSIIQLDKISDNYNNQWISPNKIVEMLSNEDKVVLIEKITELLETTPDKSVKTNIIDKIQRWCNGYELFCFLTKRMNAGKENILTAAYDIESTKGVIETYIERNSYNQDWIKTIDVEKAYFSTINKISEFSNKEQLLFYSELFHKIAE